MTSNMSMEEKPLTGPLKVMLEGQEKDTCPVLNQEQVAKIPPKIYGWIAREGVQEDLGDMGTVVRVSDSQYHTEMKRALGWIGKGADADFLMTLRLDVLKRQGDRKRNPSTKYDIYDNMLTCTFLQNRESNPI